jgi:hypothetical protein
MCWVRDRGEGFLLHPRNRFIPVTSVNEERCSGQKLIRESELKLFTPLEAGSLLCLSLFKGFYPLSLPSNYFYSNV